jgi:PAS domain S-box-containing protein
LLVAGALGALFVVTTRIVTDRSRRRGAEDLAAARSAFSRLMTARADRVVAQLRIMTALPVFRARLTEKPTALEVAAMTTMAGDCPLQLNAGFCIVTTRNGTWIAMPGWGDRGEPPMSLAAVIQAAASGAPQSAIVPVEGDLFLVVSEPARVDAETLGTITAGLALDDNVARELSEITQSQVSLVAGRHLSGSSLQGEGRAQLMRLLESDSVPSLQPGSLALQQLGDSKYLTGAFPLMSAAAGQPAGQFVLLRDWASTQQFIDELKRQFTRAGALVFIFALAGGLVFSTRVIRPFRDVAAAARDIAISRNWTSRVPVRGSSEAVTMATAFNEMSSSLRRWHEESQARSDYLESANERFHSVTESARDAIVATDEHGAITFWNRSAAVIFGYDEAGARGKSLAELMAPPDRPRCLDAFASLARGEGGAFGSSIEMEGMRRDTSTFPIELSLSAWQTDGRTHVTAVIRDITECKRAQEARLRRDEQRQQAQRMEAIGRLAGGVAHDFNNLLTAIIGFASLVRDSVPDDPLRADIDEVLGAADRAAGLTRQLLAFSRRLAFTPQIVALDEIVANMERMLRRLIGERITLSVVSAAKLGRVRADPQQIEQVLINLAVNGRDAMPEGGELRIDLSNTELDPAGALTHPGLAPGRYVQLAVTDTGTGIAPGLVSHIFEPFFTTNPEGKGTGLGLATVYGITTQNGGHIEVESQVNRGTTFHVYFPRVDATGPVVAVHEAASPIEQASETVLLVEDDDRVRGLVANVLRKRGYTVLEASRGDDALALVERHAATIHLLLSDLVMPGMSGRSVADRVAELRPDTRVLLMSGYSDDAILCGVEHAKTSFIQKPFSMEALAAKIREALSGPTLM